MTNWISTSMQEGDDEERWKARYPNAGDKVWYFFDHVGVNRGSFAGWFTDEGGEWDYFVHENGRGFLGGDVTHWMPDTGQETPPPPPVNETDKE